jgi:3-oxoadipate enol-lactonase
MAYRITPGRLSIGDFSLYFERAGSGPALVFLHGLGGNHLSWWQQVPYFARWFRCLTLDQRSFGLSPDPDGTFNESHAGDLAALLDHLGVEKAVLIGQSMGGWTIVGYALEHPERVAALVMADTHGGIMTPAMEAAMARVAGGARPVLDAEPPVGTMPTYARDFFARRPHYAHLYDSLRILGARPPRDALARIASRRYPLDKVRARLTMPVLCIVGEQDALIAPAAIRELAHTLPNARFVSVADCGHSVYFENPAVFNQILLDFLREVGYAPAEASRPDRI